MKALAVVAGIILIVLLGVAAYFKGRNDVWLMELKIYESNLIQVENFQTNVPAGLKEFMKGRFYYLSNKVRGSQPRKDYGPVSTNVAHLGIGKGPTTPQEEYRKYKERLISPAR